MSVAEGDLLQTVHAGKLSPGRIKAGQVALWGATALLALAFLVQVLFEAGAIGFGFSNWRPVLYAYFLWAVALCLSRVMIYGEQGKKALFVLPAALFVISMVVFPLIFALWVAFSDWNLASLTGREFNGLDNVRQMLGDPF
ncbi:MAG: sugar ABC transporter permease, partial [Geminicoccaceae bacterium]